MGGYGSGPGKSLAVFEEGLKLDIRRLRQQGLFVANGNYIRTRLRWTYTYSYEEVASAEIAYIAGGDGGWIQISYKFSEYDGTARNVLERIPLVRFPQPFGGYRWYFICPKTGVRCQCLYKPCGYPYFRSRVLFKGRVLYRSQKEDWRSRAFEASRRVARKVLRAGPPNWRRQHEEWDFPPKPPRMRWKTYESALEKWEEIETLSNKILMQWAARL